MLRRDFVERKLSLIQDDLVKLAALAHFTFDEIAGDYVKQAALERILERIISRAIDINEHLIAAVGGKDTSPPKDYRETFLHLAEFKVYPKDFAEEIAFKIELGRKYFIDISRSVIILLTKLKLSSSS
jgi:uncharacterized protein YutE (UPF0331/DUF86 family)